MNITSNRMFTPREGEILLDGVYCCGVCKHPVMKDYGGITGVQRIQCQCQIIEAERKKEEERKAEKEKKRAFVFERKKNGKPSQLFEFTFANDDGKNADISAILKAYCANFETHKQAGEGIVLQSAQNGSGKTFFACAVANELYDRGYNPLFTSFLSLRGKIFSPKDYGHLNEEDFLSKLEDHDIVIIDDLGAEQDTDFMYRVEYQIINRLTQVNMPLILTTNYTVSEMMNEKDIEKRRIFDRILGCCAVLTVNQPNGKSRRVERCAEITKKLTTNTGGTT